MAPLGGWDELRQATTSDAMRRALRHLEWSADDDGILLVTGPSGSGKSHLVEMLHHRGPRSNKPFVTLDLSAIPYTLAAISLFGHKRGAFTSADADAPGKIEAAAGGTLFLDEIGDMPLDLQPLLLRLLQTGTFCRVGDPRERLADVRIVLATHRNLRVMVQEGRFRADLYYRIAGSPIWVPGLDERPSDIAGLARAFAKKRAIILDDAVIERLTRHRFDGHVRELEHAVDALRRFARDGRVGLVEFALAIEERVLEGFAARAVGPTVVSAPAFARGLAPSNGRAALAQELVPVVGAWMGSGLNVVEELGLAAIEAALSRTRGNEVQAARILGMGVGQLKSYRRRGRQRDAENAELPANQNGETSEEG